MFPSCTARAAHCSWTLLMEKECNLFVIVWTVISAWQGSIMTERCFFFLSASTLQWTEGSEGHSSCTGWCTSGCTSNYTIADCACLSKVLIMWFTVVTAVCSSLAVQPTFPLKNIFLFILMHHHVTQILQMCKSQDEDSQYCLNSTKLSMENCVYTILKRLFPLSTRASLFHLYSIA